MRGSGHVDGGCEKVADLSEQKVVRERVQKYSSKKVCVLVAESIEY